MNATMTLDAPPAGALTVELARTPDQLREAQRLRYEVFAGEMGAAVTGPERGLDGDRFDQYCQHLLVRETATGEVIACTRALLDSWAAGAGGFYSQGEFDLGPILRLPGRVMEIGRTCVRRDFRTGAGIGTLWWGLFRLIRACSADYLIGCASIPMGEDGAQAAAALDVLRRRHLSPPALRVIPKLTPPLPPAPAAAAPMPPLLKAYMRLGASICGEPYWDRDFNTADVFILLETARMNPRYLRHFTGGGPGSAA